MNIVNMTVAPTAAAATCIQADACEGIPFGFMVAADGIFELPDDDLNDPIWLCSPLAVTALFHSASGDGWGRIVEVVDPNGKCNRVTLLQSELETRSGKAVAILTDRGLRLRDGPPARKAVLRLIKEWRPRETLITSDRLGWVDSPHSAYVLGDGRVLGSGRVHFTGQLFDDPVDTFAPSGTIDEWREKVASLCVGNPLLVLAVSLAFAGPLLEVLNEDGGGLHLRGASSCGKSTAQRIAASVWRNPARVGSWRTTANRSEGVAKANNSALLALDEIAEVSGKELAAAAYMLANGVGKLRAGQIGAALPPARWRLTILSTGEISIAEKMEKGGGRYMAGHDVRFLDIEADGRRHGAFDDLHGCASGAAFANLLKCQSAEHHGTAGPAFVKELIAHFSEVKDVARRAIDEEVDRMRTAFALGEDGQELRAARRLAVISIAGEIATRFRLTGWPKGDAKAAGRMALEVWIVARRARQSRGNDIARDRTSTFLTTHAASFAELAVVAGSDTCDVYGWRNADYFYIRPETWQSIHGALAEQSARKLASSGYLLPGEHRNLARKAPRSIPGRPRVYVVKAAILDAGSTVEMPKAA